MESEQSIGGVRFAALLVVAGASIAIILAGCFAEQQSDSSSRSESQSASPMLEILLVESASVESSSGKVTAIASMPRQPFERGSVVNVDIKLKIASSFHLYGPLDPSSPFTPLTIDASFDSEAISVQPTILPEAAATQDGSPVHRDSITAQLPIRIAESEPGTFPVQVRLQFQACNDLVCMPPEEILVPLLFRVQPSHRL